MFLLDPIEAYYLIKSMWQNVLDAYIDHKSNKNLFQWQKRNT